jgi:probable HAF family extracellular repeat protein
MKLTKSLVIALMSALLYAGSAHAQPHYTVTSCPIGNATAINIFGEVTGQVPDPNAPTGYRIYDGNIAICLNGKVTNLTTPATGYPNVSSGIAINDLGEVVGKYLEQGQPGYTCLHKPGQPLEILDLQTSFYAINNLGDILVSLPTLATEDNAAIYRNGVITYLGNLPGGYGSIGLGINDRDQVVGEALGNALSISNDDAFLWQDGQMTDLGTLGNLAAEGGASGWSAAYAINNRGQVVGAASTSSTFAAVVPFLWQNGVMYNLGMLPPVPGSYLETGSAVAINNLGEIVGTCTSQGWVDNEPVSTTSAFLYVGGKMYDLNSLLIPNSGYTIVNVVGINDLGVILAQTSEGTVLLTPVLPWFLPQGAAVRR